jgi:hypothetical protein
MYAYISRHLWRYAWLTFHWTLGTFCISWHRTGQADGEKQWLHHNACLSVQWTSRYLPDTWGIKSFAVYEPPIYQTSQSKSSVTQMKVPFVLDGPNGVLRHLEHLIETKGFALVCVAEGAGQVRSHRNSKEFFVTLLPVCVTLESGCCDCGCSWFFYTLVIQVLFLVAFTIDLCLLCKNYAWSNAVMNFQEYLQKSNATDASGNMVLGDIGVHLQQKVSLL